MPCKIKGRAKYIVLFLVLACLLVAGCCPNVVPASVETAEDELNALPPWSPDEDEDTLFDDISDDITQEEDDTLTDAVISFTASSEQEGFLPYYMTTGSVLNQRPWSVRGVGGYHENHILTLKAESSQPDDIVRYVVTEVTPASFRGFFAVNKRTGSLYIPHAEYNDYVKVKIPPSLRENDQRFFYVSRISHLLPESFQVKVKARNPDGASETTTVTVKKPAFGSPNCDLLDWDDAGDESWSDTQLVEYRNAICVNTDYPIRPRGLTFTTTQAYTDALPNGLSQNRANYKLIFQDEFSKNEGGFKGLDRRLWTGYLNDCNTKTKTQDGVLRLVVSDECAFIAPPGDGTPGRHPFVRLTTAGRFEYRYGYFEVRLLRLIDASSSTTDFGISQWGRYKNSDRAAYASDEFRRYLCRGNDALAKRKRYLSMWGTEMQFMETRVYGSGAWRYPMGWLVFHLDGWSPYNCHTYPSVSGRNPGIRSGHLVDTFYFPSDASVWQSPLDVSSLPFGQSHAQRIIASDASFTIGMEWTPAGYKFFLNGQPHPSLPSRRFYAYGFATTQNTQTYVYDPQTVPADGFIRQSVSHAHQGIQLVLFDLPTAYYTPPEGWEQKVYVDHIRVYQPQDKYATVTPTYQ